MVEQMETVMEGLRKEKDQLMEDIEVKEVRMKRSPELQKDEELREELLQGIQAQK